MYDVHYMTCIISRYLYLDISLGILVLDSLKIESRLISVSKYFLYILFIKDLISLSTVHTVPTEVTHSNAVIRIL